ncbi:MAG: hypothetical protein V3R37_07120 [Rhodospirillales bacterium]
MTEVTTRIRPEPIITKVSISTMRALNSPRVMTSTVSTMALSR